MPTLLSYTALSNKTGINNPQTKKTKSIPGFLLLAPELLDGIGAIDVRDGIWDGVGVGDGVPAADTEPLTGDEIGVAVAKWQITDGAISFETNALQLPDGTHLFGPSTRSSYGTHRAPTPRRQETFWHTAGRRNG